MVVDVRADGWHRGGVCVCEDFSMRPYTVTTSTPAKSTLFSASACECPSTYSLYHHPEPAEPSSTEKQG